MASGPLSQPQEGSCRPSSWFDLPPELRIEILELVSGDSHLSAYAAVCSEWQWFFEKITFRSLAFNNTYLQFFDQIFSGKNAHRARFVQYIRLLIKGPEFGCVCSSSSSWAAQRRSSQNNRIFTTTMEKFLKILSTWARGDGSSGITLELGVMSYFDDEYLSDGFPIRDRYPFQTWDRRIKPIDIERDHVADYLKTRDLYNTQCPDNPPVPGLLHTTTWYPRFLIEFEGLAMARLPRVPVISSLVMRRRYRRQLSPLALGQIFRESLVCAKSFRLERWCRAPEDEENQYLSDFREHVLPSLPNTLEVLQCASQLLCGPLSTSPGLNSLSMLEMLSHYGHRFRELGIVEPSGTPGHLVAAKDQKLLINIPIESLQPTPWLRLERVCFASEVLAPGAEHAPEISRLLVSAASLSENMPNLRTMEIFNAGVQTYQPTYLREGTACLFRYSTEHSQPVLSWQSSWNLRPYIEPSEFSFTPETKRAWQKTALMHTGRALTFVVLEPQKLEKTRHNSDASEALQSP